MTSIACFFISNSPTFGDMVKGEKLTKWQSNTVGKMKSCTSNNHDTTLDVERKKESVFKF